MSMKGGGFDNLPPAYDESEWGGESENEFHPHHPGHTYPQQAPKAQGDEAQTENFRALLFAEGKGIRDDLKFLDQKNERTHGHLFDRVQDLENAMGPALGSASTFEDMVSEGEKRVKSQEDVAINYLFDEAKKLYTG